MPCNNGCACNHTVKISANGTAAYKLDGVRVYNPVQTGSAAETALNQTDEANATYLNLRAPAECRKRFQRHAAGWNERRG